MKTKNKSIAFKDKQNGVCFSQRYGQRTRKPPLRETTAQCFPPDFLSPPHPPVQMPLCCWRGSAALISLRCLSLLFIFVSGWIKIFLNVCNSVKVRVGVRSLSCPFQSPSFSRFPPEVVQGLKILLSLLALSSSSSSYWSCLWNAASFMLVVSISETDPCF